MVNIVQSELEIKSLKGKTDQDIQSIINQENNISNLTDYRDQCSNMGKYELSAEIRDKINKLHQKDNKAEMNGLQESKDQYKIEMSELKEKEEETKKALLSDLVTKLHNDGNPVSGVDFSVDYQNTFDTFLLSIKNDLSSIRKTYDFVFDNYKGDLNKMKDELQRLRQMELNLSNKLQTEIPKYADKEIATLPLYTYRLFPKKIMVNTPEGIKKAWLAPERLKFNSKLRTRNRLNKTIKTFNDIGNDAEKAMKYFLSKTSWYRGGNMTKGAKMLFGTIEDGLTSRVQSLGTLDKKYLEMKQKFIDNLVGDKSDFDQKEKNAISSLQTRLDYYYARYKRTHYGV